MLTRTKTALTGIAAAAMIAAGSLVAVPAAQAETAFQNGVVQTVAWKGGKGNWRQGNNWKGGNWQHNGGWNDHNGWRRNNGNNWVGPAIGFGTGLVIGSMLAQPRYSSHDAYCHQIHPSYKSWTGTYTTYSGREVPC